MLDGEIDTVFGCKVLRFEFYFLVWSMDGQQEECIPLQQCSDSKQQPLDLKLNSAYDEFIDCGPSPPGDEVPNIFDLFEDQGSVSSDTAVRVCNHTVERSLLDHMEGVGGRLELLQDIQERRVDQENIVKIFYGATPPEVSVSFLWAAFVKRWDLLQGFISLGAELNYYEPSQGLGALHLAAFSGCIPGVQFLISQGCDVNALYKFYTPLHCAAFGDSPDTLLILLHHGANIQDLTKSSHHANESALHCAVRANSTSCVRVLVNEGADVGQLEFSGLSPIHLAADFGYTTCLQCLLESKGINVNTKSKDKNQTPLHLASMRGYQDCVEFLLSKGANPNLKNHMGQTALHLAARAQSYECVHLLLTKGNANPNIEDCDKRTPLHAAVGTSPRSSDIIEVLVKYGASKNIKDQYGYTPLHIAALKGLSQCVETLIFFGADVTARTKSGMTALSIITKKVPASFSMFKKKLDSAITLHQPQSSNHEIELRLDFRVILQYCHPKEIIFLNTLVDEGYKKVLLHPLCSALLYLKWEKIRKYYFARVVFSCILVLSLSLYVLTALAHHCYNYGKNFKEMKPEDIIELCEKKSIMGQLLRDNPFVIEMQWFVLVGFTACEIVRKVYGMSGYDSVKQYFSYAENIIEWSVVISVFVISFIYTGRTYTWQNHIGAFAVLLGWTNLMLMIGQLPVFGSYVAMYTRVQSEFGKLLLAYSGLLIGFTLSFCVIFPDSSTFANPFISLITIIVMMSGELNLDILVDDNPENPHFLLEVSAQVTYVIFVLSVTIILMNLLVGIAVDDIKGLQKTAGLSKLIRQTKLITHMELALFSGSLPRYLSNLVHWTALVSPRPSKVVLNLKPLNPRENRLPKEIIKGAFDIALKNKHSVHPLSPGSSTEYFWLNDDRIQDHAECIENNATFTMLREELENKSEQIDNLSREVQYMKNAFLANQDTLEQLLRTINQGRRASRC
ncbi:unnamed protein product [Callosobruchus maculatus]|uniref:Ion transport domain-containing protein n=3 Tax=Callosobruchus maculatus TaxID=64391 RepID=A0A653CND3_CALMS|nr:unnamed protein product [Callosobruchus maculatus]